MKNGSLYYRRIRKNIGIMLVMSILISLAVMPQIASADTEYVEQLIYSQNFSNFTENVDYVKEGYSSSSEAGKWYIGTGGRVMSHNLAYGAFAKGVDSYGTFVPYMFPSGFDNTQNEYEVSFSYKNWKWVTNIYLVDSTGGNIKVSNDIWSDESFAYSPYTLTINSTNCTVSTGGVGGYADYNVSVSGKSIVGMYLKVQGKTSSYANAFGWIDDLVIKQGDTVILSENFDNWQRADITAQQTAMSELINLHLDTETTPTLYTRDSGSDKCLATKWHRYNTDEYITFVFPEVMSSGKYKITYDYLAGGSWSDHLYIGTTDTVTQEPASHITLNCTQSNWVATTLDIDIDAGTWSRNGYHASEMTVDNKTNRITFRLHKSAANGVEMLIDNFKIYKLVAADPNPEPEVLASFPGETVNYGRTFENLTPSEVASWYTDAQITNGGFRSYNDVNGVVQGYNSSRALSPTYGMTASNKGERYLDFYPVPEPVSGVHHFRFDYKAGTSEDSRSNIQLYYKSNNNWVAHVIYDTTELWGTEWVNIDLVINYDTSTWNVTAVPYNNSLNTYTNSGAFTSGQQVYIRFNYSASTPSNRTFENSPAIDNFYWTTERSNEVIPDGAFSITSYEFTDDIGLPLSSVPTSGTIAANVVLGINTPGNYSFYAIIATYAADGSLLDVDLDTVSVRSNEASKAVSLEIGAATQTHSCKVFFWDMSNGALTPLTTAIPFPAD